MNFTQQALKRHIPGSFTLSLRVSYDLYGKLLAHCLKSGIKVETKSDPLKLPLEAIATQLSGPTTFEDFKVLLKSAGLEDVLQEGRSSRQLKIETLRQSLQSESMPPSGTEKASLVALLEKNPAAKERFLALCEEREWNVEAEEELELMRKALDENR